jgi:hypothetical protein
VGCQDGGWTVAVERIWVGAIIISYGGARLPFPSGSGVGPVRCTVSSGLYGRTSEVGCCWSSDTMRVRGVLVVVGSLVL